MVITRTHPAGHCRRCGEPLRFRPCLNCQGSILSEERVERRSES